MDFPKAIGHLELILSYCQLQGWGPVFFAFGWVRAPLNLHNLKSQAAPKYEG